MIAGDGALLTDLYQLTMLQAYRAEGMAEEAVFELFVRELPRGRGFLLAAGLEQALDWLETLRFTEDELAWLADSGRLRTDFIAWLRALRFSGAVHALPEGSVCFAGEPLLRVCAPLPEAQLVETRLLNLLHLQTLVASKAARCVLAAPSKRLVDFGLRRAHGAEAGLLAARAAYLAGFAGTATVAAGARFGIPLFGTMAHSLVQAHASEADAFLGFARSQPDNVVLLIDTYDTEAAAATVVELAPRLAAEGIRIKGVRIDSGDLGALAVRVRAILDAGGLAETFIFASGDLDEQRLLALRGVPIDGFGIGTRLDTSSDAPYLHCVYKLQEYAGVPRRKRSPGKLTWPGRRQVWRARTADGGFVGDLVGLEGAAHPGEALLVPVMRDGRRLAPPEPLAVIRRRAAAQLAALPLHLRALATEPPYPVTIASELEALAASVDAGRG